MDKRPAVIFDIDGTLANITHRLHHIAIRYEGDKPRWDDFHAECGRDECYHSIAHILRMYYKQGFVVFLMTGRMLKNMEKTQAWLDFYSIPYYQLYMRGNDDYRSDYIIKQEMYDNIKDDFDVHAVFEDRDRVVEMWRSNGLICLQTKKGDY